MDLDIILKEFDSQNRDDLEIIRAVLPYCSHTIQVSFALHCCLDVEYHMTDKRSTNVVRAIELFLRTGAKITEEVVNAAYYAACTNTTAASTASTAYYAASTAYHANYAANYATYATYAANYAATAASADPNAYKDKMRSYLNKLKELISMEYSSNLPEDVAWLLAAVI